MGVGYFHDSPEAKLARTVDIYENRRPSQVTDFFFSFIMHRHA